jgi:hypothetical protein
VKNGTTNLLAQFALILLSLALAAEPVSAQNAPRNQSTTNVVKTNSRMLYHDGPVRTGIQDVYYIFYGCWTNSCGLGVTGDIRRKIECLGFFQSPTQNLRYGEPDASDYD